ncbi:MAG: hypothetical protein ACFFAJ_10955 [Candidatus Hodarchaeota archaeon]
MKQDDKHYRRLVIKGLNCPRLVSLSERLEELQAEVFNEANLFKFQPANADQIKKQYEKEKVDPNTIKYVFLEDKMVGYIQARIREKLREVHFGFPWVLPGTPMEVQNKLFDDMLSYIQHQDKFADFKIRVNAMAKPEENLDFLRKRGFVEKNVWKTLFLPLPSVAQAKYDEKFSARIGTEEDIDLVISLIKKDGRYASQFPSDNDIREYLVEEVLSTGHLVLVYENNSLTAASAPLVFKSSQEEEERIILRFTAFKDIKNQEAYIPLLVEVAKECLKSGYGKEKPILVYTDSMDSPREQIEFLKQQSSIKTEILMYYYYLEK